MPAVSDVVRTIRTRVARVRADGKVGVACSGGADSIVLADAAIAVFGAARVVLVHVDHGVRPKASRDRDLAAVRALHGAEVRVLRVSVDKPSEASLRRARYAALDAEDDLMVIMTAHTARDQAETVLMRVIRGTGPAGLAGIAPRRGRYVRPLLTTTRAEIEGYAAARGLHVSHDETNDSPRYLRNRIRASIMPALAVENPQLEAALGRLAASARSWRRALMRDAKALLEGALEATRFAKAPDAVLALALGRAAEQAGMHPDATHLRAMIRLVRAKTAGSRSLDLPGGRFIREYDSLVFDAGPAAPPPLDVDCGEPFDVRLVQPGDRMRPARLKGRSRKLSDLFTDARVPRRLRATARVVVRRADQVILWAEHVGLAHASNIRVSTGP